MQRRPKPGGGWEWTTKGTRLVPYNLPRVLQAPVILILEGEKDCDRAVGLGFVATTCPWGAGKWRAEYAVHFRGKVVVIIPDNDKTGLDHALDVARSLFGVAKSVKIVTLPGVEEKGDLSDWLDQRHTAMELVDLIDATPTWIPPATPTASPAAAATPIVHPPVAPGTIVRAMDRANFGEVVADQGDSCLVHFRNPATGDQADVVLPKTQLVNQDGKPLAKPDKQIDYGLISAGALLRGSYAVEWLIPHVMARLQHMLWGGPLKACKSLLAIDAAVALALGDKLLGHFPVTRPTRVMFLSGEAGWPVLQENIRRISRAAGASDEQLDQNLVVGVKLPKFGVPTYIDALAEAIKRHGSEVVFLDCAYRCIPGDNASNVFAMGELLDSIGRVFEDSKSTLILLHHSPKHIPAGEPLQLDNLAFAGFGEFSAQWFLINRQKPFVPGSGHHDLWITVGGRAGHSGLFGVQIDEGQFEIGRDRDWRVSVTRAEEVWQDAKSQRQAAKQTEQNDKKNRRIEDAQKAIVEAMVRLGPETKTNIMAASGVHQRVFDEPFGLLIRDGNVVPCDVYRDNRKTPYEGFKLSDSDATHE